MQNLRSLRQRIRSVQNTQKITRAMQMVAGAKLRRSQGELISFRPYADRLGLITQRFLAAHPVLEHPLVSGTRVIARSGRDEAIPGIASPAKERSRLAMMGAPTPVGLVVVSSDTGLCGTYNERVLSLAERFLLEHPSAVVVTIGKKGSRFLSRRGIRRIQEVLDWGGRFDPSRVASLADWIESLYLQGNVSAWWIASTRFISALRWKATVDRFLPLERPASLELSEKIIAEPDPPTVADRLLNHFAATQFSRILLEAFTAEHSARMIAMKNATDNAAEMIESLTLVRNKVRQAAITKELIEVVSGAEALR